MAHPDVRRWLAVALLVAFGLGADSELTEEVHVRLVQSPLVATDRKGHPVTDLTAAEIRVKDRGRPREVAFLEPLVRGRGTEPLAKAFLFIDAPGGGGDAVSESALDEPRHLAILVDVETEPPLGRMEAAEDAVRFVRAHAAADSRVAVFSYDGEIQQELLFATGDAEAAEIAVMGAFDRPGRPQVDLRARTRELVTDLEECVVDRGTSVATGGERCMHDVALAYADQLRPAAEDYLAALDSLVRLLSGLRGRKTVYALSHGVSMDPTAEIAEAMRAVLGPTEQVADMIGYLGFSEGARTKLDRLIELALREGVVLHFIDRTPPPTADRGASQAHGYQAGAQPTLAAYEAPQIDLEQIAVATGGTFAAETDVFLGLSQAFDLERGTYMLGYHVDEFLTPKQLRNVSVRSTRSGVKLAHRRGYYDPPPRRDIEGQVLVGPTAPAKSRRALELGLSGHSFVPFQIVADPHGLDYKPAGEEAAASFTLHVQIQDAAGRIVTDGFRFVAHSYPLATWESGRVEPIRIQGWVELPRGTYRLIAKVHDPASGRQGEWVATLEMPVRE